MNVNKDPNSKKIFVVDSENVDVFSLLKHLYFVSDYSLVLTRCPPKTVSKSVSQSLNQQVSNSLIQ